MNWFFLVAVICGLLTGFTLGAQPGINGYLGKQVSHPLQASVISFTTGLVLLLVISLAMRVMPPKFVVPPTQLPWWTWMGGVIGAITVTCSLFFAPHTGAFIWISLLVAGQILSSLLLDHYGLAGHAIHSITPQRMIGAVLLVVGVVLVCLK